MKTWRNLAVRMVICCWIVGGTGGLIGIIVSCVVLVLFGVGAFFGFFIVSKCRTHAKPSDNTSDQQHRRTQIDDGCALPVDIPVTAFAREPPPRYDAIDEPTVDTASVSGRRRNDYLATVISDNPPAYSEAVTSLDDRIVSSRRNDFRSTPFLVSTGRSSDLPPGYRSRVGLDTSRYSVPEQSNLTSDTSFRIFPPPPMTMPLCAGSVSAARSRLHSVESFPDIPSMSDVLLTSSRTTLPTSGSQADALDAAGPNSTQQPGESSRDASASMRPRSAIISSRSTDNVYRLSSDDVTLGGTSRSPRDVTSSSKRRRRGDIEASSSSLVQSPTSAATNDVTASQPPSCASTAISEMEPISNGKRYHRRRQQHPDPSSMSRSLPGLSTVTQEPPENLPSAGTSSMSSLKVVGLETVV